MADDIYKVDENPVYQKEIRAWQNNDPANAATILNPVIETMLNNIHRVKLDGNKADAAIGTLQKKINYGTSLPTAGMQEGDIFILYEK